MPSNKAVNKLTLWDRDESTIKLAAFNGERVELEVKSGSVTFNNVEYHVSFNLPDGSLLKGTAIKSRDEAVGVSLHVSDLSRFGKMSLDSVSFASRREILDKVLSPFPDEYGFHLFGGRCVAPRVYFAIGVTAASCEKCQDPRLVGFEAFKLSSLTGSTLVLLGSEEDVDDGVDGLDKFPPVIDESKRVSAYKPLIRSMIRKMTGKWRDVYLRKHQPSLLPYDYEDLMQFGFMQVTIALRKYKPDNKWKAKEATFVYQHLWHRFGQIAHKYSKQSKGYGAQHVRDYIDDEGKLVSAYDIGGQEDGD